MSGWVRFENTTPENLKVVTLSDKAFRLWFNANCYCSRNETDGRVPAPIITSLSITATQRTVTELLEAGLLEQLDTQTYVIHDYLDYNPSRSRIREMRDGGRDRVARHREGKRNGNDVTDPSVTALHDRYPRARDRSDTDTDSVSCSSQDESKPGRSPSKRVDQHELPAVLPADLHSVAGAALRVLEGVQMERGGDVPTIRGVGLAMLRCPNRDFLRVVRELEHWALAGRGQRKPVKDWARTFGTFLDNAPEGAPVRQGNVLSMQRPAVARANAWQDGYGGGAA